MINLTKFRIFSTTACDNHLFNTYRCSISDGKSCKGNFEDPAVSFIITKRPYDWYFSLYAKDNQEDGIITLTQENICFAITPAKSYEILYYRRPWERVLLGYKSPNSFNPSSADHLSTSFKWSRVFPSFVSLFSCQDSRTLLMDIFIKDVHCT
jgi:hypothetical protein